MERMIKIPISKKKGKNYPIRELKRDHEKYDVDTQSFTWLNQGQAHMVAKQLNKRGYDTSIVNTGQGGNIHSVYVVRKK